MAGKRRRRERRARPVKKGTITSPELENGGKLNPASFGPSGIIDEEDKGPVSIPWAVTKKITTSPEHLFVCARLPQSIRADLSKLADSVAGSEKAEDVDHITILYIPPNGRGEIPKEKADAAEKAAREALKNTGTIKAKVQGWGYFDGAEKGGEKKTALVALIDAPGLAEVHVVLKEALTKLGFPADKQTHGYVPHATIAYLPKGERAKDELPVIDREFDIGQVELVHSNIRRLALSEKIKDVDDYDPKELSDEVLRDDFRIVLAWFASYTEDPENFKYEESSLRKLLRQILREAKQRGPDTIVFDPAGMKESVRPFFLDAARDVGIPDEQIKKAETWRSRDKPWKVEDIDERPTNELIARHWDLHLEFHRGEKRSTEDIVNEHALIVDELFGRGVKHPAPPDNGLDDLSQDFEKNEDKQPDWTQPVKKRVLAVTHPSGEVKGRKVELREVLDHFRTFKLRAPMVYLVGGLATQGWTENDIDILIRGSGSMSPEMLRTLKFRLGRALPPELSERVQFLTDDKAGGPFTDYVELYDLQAERINPENEIKEMRDIEKDSNPAIWTSPGGKAKLSRRLVSLLPSHKTYVEPFCGSAAVLFRKEPCAVEVINDLDKPIADAFRIIKTLTKADYEKLGRMNWTSSRDQYYKLLKSEPTDKLGKLYKFLYTSYFSYGSMRHHGYNYTRQGKTAQVLLDRCKRSQPRLKKVKVYSEDYGKVIEKYDSKLTVFFLDPPYAGTNGDIGEKDFDEERFMSILKNMKGRFLLTYGIRGKLPALLRAEKKFYVKRIVVPRGPLGRVSNIGGKKRQLHHQLVVANYDLAEKMASVEPPEEHPVVREIVEWLGLVEVTDAEIEELAMQEPRAASSKLLSQANEAARADKLTLGEFFYQPKPTRPAFPEELQSVERFISLYRERPKWLPTFVQKKYDGANHQIHKLGDKVVILSEDGEDNTERLPGVVEEVQKLDSKNLILVAELEMWKGTQHLPREVVAGYLHSEDSPDDSALIANVYDVLWVEPHGDIHKWETYRRLDFLKKLGFKQSTMGTPDLAHRLNAAPGEKAHDLGELERAVRKIRKLPGSEGVVAKHADAVYPPKTTTPDSWVKLHNATTIRGVVIDRMRTKGGVWVYRYGILPGRRDPYHVVDVGARKIMPVGDTFSTKRSFEKGDGILVEAETVNVTRGPTGERLSAWVPRVIGEWEGRPDTVDSAAKRAAGELVLQQKEVDEDGNVRYLPTGRIRKQADPYMEIPAEGKPYRFVVHEHWRGRSLHADLRIVLRRGKLLIGWTLNTPIAGKVKDPVVTLAEAKAETDQMDDYSKIDWRSGEWKKRAKRGSTKPVRTEILSERKAPEPYEWIDVEGTTKKPAEGERPPVGGTRRFPGVFNIVEQGIVEYGAQKPWFHEYFLHGRNNRYRIIFRQLRLEKAAHSRSRCMFKGCKRAPEVDVLWADGRGRAWFCKEHLAAWKQDFVDRGEEEWLEIVGEKEVTTGEVPEKWADVHKAEVIVSKSILPPSEPEARPMPGAKWLAIRPDDLTPYVLAPDDKKWMPPAGVSALPAAIRDQVPAEYRYWKKRNAREVRDRLIEAMKKGEVEIDFAKPYGRGVSKASLLDAEFVVQEQTWRGPIQIRTGPSRKLWWLRLDVGRPDLVAVKMFQNPVDNEQVTAEVDSDPHKNSMDLDGPLRAGHYLNPTKETPSSIERIDSGKAAVLSLENDFIKVEFKGKKLKGLYALKKNDGEWLMSPTERSPEVEKSSSAEIRIEVPIIKADKEKRIATGIVLEPDTVDAHGDTIDAEAIERAAHNFLAKYNKETRLGLLHEIFGDIGVELVECWVAPVDMMLGGQKVRKGTWLMSHKILDEALWKQIKAGEITGLSIGGVATVV